MWGSSRGCLLRERDLGLEDAGLLELDGGVALHEHGGVGTHGAGGVDEASKLVAEGPREVVAEGAVDDGVAARAEVFADVGKDDALRGGADGEGLGGPVTRRGSVCLGDDGRAGVARHHRAVGDKWTREGSRASVPRAIAKTAKDASGDEPRRHWARDGVGRCGQPSGATTIVDADHP